MLGIGDTRVIEPLTMPLRDAAPPLPTGSIEAEEVPEAVRPQPVPLVRLLLPVVMIAAMLGMVALMVLGAGESRQISPMALMFPLMMLASMAMMLGPITAGRTRMKPGVPTCATLKPCGKRRCAMPRRSVHMKVIATRHRWNLAL